MGAESDTLIASIVFTCFGVAAYILVSVIKPLWPLKSRRPLIPLTIALIVIGPLTLAAVVPSAQTSPSAKEANQASTAAPTDTSVLGEDVPIVQVADRNDAAESEPDLNIAALTITTERSAES